MKGRLSYRGVSKLCYNVAYKCGNVWMGAILTKVLRKNYLTGYETTVFAHFSFPLILSTSSKMFNFTKIFTKSCKCDFRRLLWLKKSHYQKKRWSYRLFLWTKQISPFYIELLQQTPTMKAARERFILLYSRKIKIHNLGSTADNKFAVRFGCILPFVRANCGLENRMICILHGNTLQIECNVISHQKWHLSNSLKSWMAKPTTWIIKILFLNLFGKDGSEQVKK